ncbi:MAG: GatB/YqeY domain-containing protein [Schwartzia sp.]|nr:GatB/YqeY domain-containing protein [Schwartzia sp. (in: firmicutes)]
MTLKDKLTADMKDAMKAKEAGKQRLSVIRLVRGAVRQQEIDGKKELSDEDVLAVISKEVKQRRDSIEDFQKGGRDDLVAEAEAEIAILMEYLPEQLSEDEVRSLVKEAVAKSGATSPKDMGKVMKELMPKVKGRADGKLVNGIVKEFLAQ